MVMGLARRDLPAHLSTNYLGAAFGAVGWDYHLPSSTEELYQYRVNEAGDKFALSSVFCRQ